jgi:hypothetical protein
MTSPPSPVQYELGAEDSHLQMRRNLQKSELPREFIRLRVGQLKEVFGEETCVVDETGAELGFRFSGR